MSDIARRAASRRRAFLTRTGAALPLLVGLGAGPQETLAQESATRTKSRSKTDGSGNYNVKDFGATGDGLHDDTIAIQTALDAASAAGGGNVVVPAGVYSTRTLTINSKVHLTGAGIEATILKLRDGTHDDLLRTFGYAKLVGTSSTDGPFNWSVRNLTLDGNRVKNTSGSGLRIYGWGYVLSDLRIRQCARAGIDSEWSTDDPPESPGGMNTPGDSMEAQLVNLKVHNCGAGGILFRGPHDSQFVNCVVFSTKTYGFHIHSSKKFSATGCQLVNCHTWGYHVYGYKIEAGFVTLVNCMGEWASSAQVHLNDGDATIVGGRYFGNPKAAHVGIEIGSPGNIVYGSHIDARMSDLVGGAFKFTNEGGSSKIKALVYQTSGVPYTGKPARGTLLELFVNGIASGSEDWFPLGSLGWNGGTPIVRHLSGTTRWAPPVLAAGGATWAEVKVEGASVGDTVAVGFNRPVPPGVMLSGAVSEPDVVAITLLNVTKRSVRLGEGVLRADCWVH